MQCTSCQAPLRPGGKFCTHCGERVQSVCAACGSVNLANDQFCSTCGSGLTKAASPPDTSSEPNHNQADRRQVSVMFCDLVGSTTLASHLDPEDMRLIIRTYQSAARDAIASHEGFIARYMGDGILVHFGYPLAREDSAARAVSAALAVIEAVQREAQGVRQKTQARLAVRVGIATGMVIAGDLIGEGLAEEQAIVGKTPNLAARLQSVAKSNSALICDNTRHLIGSMFELEDFGKHRLKGIPQSEQTWQVSGQNHRSSRFEAIRGERLSKMVGREEELALLTRRWDSARAGEGQVVLISGEPGIGKSRLVKTMRESLQNKKFHYMRYQSSPDHTTTPLYPVVLQVRFAAGFRLGDSADVQREKLSALLNQTGARSEQHIDAFFKLLSLDRDGTSELAQKNTKEIIFKALVDEMRAISKVMPILVIFEDIHWLDPDTAELLERVIHAARQFNMLIMITQRPGETPAWVDRPHVTMLTLNRLNNRQSASLVNKVVGEKPLPPEVLDTILSKTDGVPLFIEELTRTLLASSSVAEESDRYVLNGELPRSAVPETLQASLSARIDQLAEAKIVAQIGSVLGRRFLHQLLVAVAEMLDPQLASALEKLIEKGVLTRQGDLPWATYNFKHALLRDAAYDSMLRDQRRALHLRAANAIRDQFPDMAQILPERLAHHYALAGEIDQAIACWRNAGDIATAKSQHDEACTRYQQALEALTEVAMDDKRRQQELELLLLLGAALITSKGPGSTQLKAVYSRAVVVCNTLPESADHFAVQWGLWRTTAEQDFQASHQQAKSLLTIAQRLDDPGLIMQAHHALWGSSFNLGDCRSSLEHIEKGLDIYAQADYTGQAAKYGGHDPGICAHGEAALICCIQGKQSQSLEILNRAWAITEQIKHPATTDHLTNVALMIHRYWRDTDAVAELALRLQESPESSRISKSLSKSAIFGGWAQALAGEIDEGIAQIQSGVAAQERMGSSEYMPVFRCMLAESLALSGDVTTAIRQLQLALNEAESGSLRIWEPELHYHHGCLLVLNQQTPEAESALLFSLQLADIQHARIISLRAACELFHLYQGNNRADEAHRLLKTTLENLGHEFNGPDLTTARELLNSLDTAESGRP